MADCLGTWVLVSMMTYRAREATTTALKRLSENNSTTKKDIIKPFSDLKSTHFILPPLRFWQLSSFYHRSWCENSPFSPLVWPPGQTTPKIPKTHTNENSLYISKKKLR